MNVLEFFHLIRNIWEKRDQLAEMYEKIPDALTKAGQQIEEAGTGCVTVSHYLHGGGGVQFNASAAIATSGNVINEASTKITHVAMVLSTIAVVLDSIKVPVLKMDYVEVLGIKVVKDVAIVKESILKGVADEIREVRSDLNDFGNQLSTAADQLETVSDALDKAGDRVESLGVKLQTGGQRLQEAVA